MLDYYFVTISWSGRLAITMIHSVSTVRLTWLRSDPNTIRKAGRKGGSSKFKIFRLSLQAHSWYCRFLIMGSSQSWGKSCVIHIRVAIIIFLYIFN